MKKTEVSTDDQATRSPTNITADSRRNSPVPPPPVVPASEDSASASNHRSNEQEIMQNNVSRKQRVALAPAVARDEITTTTTREAKRVRGKKYDKANSAALTINNDNHMSRFSPGAISIPGAHCEDDHEIPDNEDISQQNNVTVLFSGGMAKKKGGRAHRHKIKSKTPFVDEALTMNNNQMSLSSPGAFSVPGTNRDPSLGSPNSNEELLVGNNDCRSEISLIETGLVGGDDRRSPSPVVATQLVNQHNDEEIVQDEDQENRFVQHEEHGATTLEWAEVVPGSITTSWKQLCWRWRYVLLFILLCSFVIYATVLLLKLL